MSYQPPQGYPPPGYPPQPPPSRGSMLAVVIVVALVAVAGGGAGAYWLLRNQTPRTESNAPPVSSADTAFRRYTSAQVIEAFRTASVELGAVMPIETTVRGAAPPTEVEGVRFIIPSLGPDNGGRIFSFATPQDLEVKRRYYDQIAQRTPFGFSWLFTKGNILVQINGTLPRAKAEQYHAALEAMR